MNEQTSESNILIVDDKPENLRLLSKILKEKGYKVRSLRKGQMVFSSVLNSPPDIILLDIMMPEMDGYEVCQQLKADEQTRDIPIIFISALDEATDKVRGFNLGGADYIVKPFQEQEVLARVKNHLAMRNIQKRLEEKNAQLSALHQISLELVGQTDLDDLLQNILNSAARLTNVSDGFIYLYNPKNDDLEIRFAIGAFVRHIGLRLGPGQGVAGKVFQTGQPLLVEDYRIYEGRAANPVFDSICFVAGIPLKSENQVVGVIGLTCSEKEDSIGQEDIRILELFAKLASVALNNARLCTALKDEIEEHRRTEEALRESEALFRFQFEYGNIGIAVTSVEKRWVRVNPRLLGMLGYSEDELGEKTWSEMTHPDDLAEDMKQYGRLLAGEIEAYELDKRFFRKDKSILKPILRFPAAGMRTDQSFL